MPDNSEIIEEQKELDFGLIENKPTRIQDIPETSPRPEMDHKEVLKYGCLELAKLIEDESYETLEELQEQIEDHILDKSWKHDLFLSEYRLFDFLVNTLYCDEEYAFDLKEDLESVCWKTRCFKDKKVKEWVSWWNIIPPVNIGDKINYKDEECEVVTLDKESAFVGLYIPSAAAERTVGKYLHSNIRYEEIVKWI